MNKHRNKIRTPFYLSPPLLIHDPMTGESKIGTSKWSIFLQDIRSESTNLKEACSKALSQHAQVNNNYKKTSQISFNAIHNVKRTFPPRDQSTIQKVPRSKPKPAEFNYLTSPKETEVDIFDPNAPFEFKYHEWPKRSTSSSKRLLNPDKLKSVYGLEKRHTDTYIITGEQISPSEAY